MSQLRIDTDEQSRRVLAQRARAPRAAVIALRAALGQGLEEMAAHVQVQMLTGGDWRTPRKGRPPLAVRSGDLRRSIVSRLDPAGPGAGAISGVVGATRGPASAYARAVLGEGDTTIRPKNAKHLWIPIGDNLTAGGAMRMSPREAMAERGPRGGRRLRIFKSRAGNLVAFLPAPGGGRYTRGKNKGRSRGRLLFVLKDKVVVRGVDALGRGYHDKRERMRQLLNDALWRGAQGEAPAGGLA